MDTERPQVVTPETPAEQKAIENTKGVIGVIEGLYRGIEAGSFPLQVHTHVMAGMNFLAQFHKQLVGQLPADVVTEMRAKAEANNGPKA